MEYKEIKGDLIQLSKENNFDLIAHGCNCFCTMNSGIAKLIKDEFPVVYSIDCQTIRGDINKLGTFSKWIGENFEIYNLYTQYRYGIDKVYLDYDALTLCLRKLNYLNRGKRIGLCKIGCGLAKGDWNIVKSIIQRELRDMNVTIVIL